MKKYIAPELKNNLLEIEDIILASREFNNNDLDAEGTWDWQQK